jgi:hypothetical protein
MAAVAQIKINHPFCLGVLSPYIENKNVRYSLYALSVLAIGTATFRYGNIKIGCTLVSAGCFVQGYKLVQLARELKKNPNIGREQKISRITDCVFKMGLMWGIIISGLNLSLLYHEGTLLLQGADRNSISSLLEAGLKNPRVLIYAWLKNAPSILYRFNNILSLGCFAIPQAYNFIYWTDDLFYGKQILANQVFQLCEKALNIWIASQSEVTLDSLFYMLKDMVQSLKLWSYLSKVTGEIPSQMSAVWIAFQNSLPLLARLSTISLKDLNQWIRSFSNTDTPIVVAQQKNSDGWEKTKYVVNHIFFHTLNFSLMATRLYYHFFPTAVFFGLGLFYPTAYQNEITLQRTWQAAPDFVGLPLIMKCRYILDRTSVALTSLQWWNIPVAALNGLYLAEAFRFYGRRFLS